MKPPAHTGSGLKARRVQSAGCARRKPPTSRTEKPVTKKDKCSRPASAKQTGMRKKATNGSVNSSAVNTISSAFGGKGGLRAYIREKIPGYFTEQYKRILEERKRTNKQMDKMKKGAASSSSLTLVPKEMSEDSGNLSGESEKHYDTTETSLGSDYKKDKTSLQTLNIERSGPYEAESQSGKQGKNSQRENISQGSSSGIFVTGDDKNELRAEHTAKDSSSGVETMSYVTDCPSFERFADASDGAKCKSPREYGGRETFGSGYGKGGWDDGDYEVYCDEIDCDDDDDYDDDDYYFGADVSNLEVVANPKPLSESRYLKHKKPIAPFPPVCFCINARPLDGYVYYFAYGPDMNPNSITLVQCFLCGCLTAQVPLSMVFHSSPCQRFYMSRRTIGSHQALLRSWIVATV